MFNIFFLFTLVFFSLPLDENDTKDFYRHMFCLFSFFSLFTLLPHDENDTKGFFSLNSKKISHVLLLSPLMARTARMFPLSLYFSTTREHVFLSPFVMRHFLYLSLSRKTILFLFAIFDNYTDTSVLHLMKATQQFPVEPHSRETTPEFFPRKQRRIAFQEYPPRQESDIDDKFLVRFDGRIRDFTFPTNVETHLRDYRFQLPPMTAFKIFLYKTTKNMILHPQIFSGWQCCKAKEKPEEEHD